MKKAAITGAATPRIKPVKITPDLAAKWLEERNTHNRKLDDNHVQDLANAMRRGEWKLVNDAIAFDTKGVLQNGQHRLWAIVESGQTIELFVAEGLEPAAQEAMDYGKKRNLASQLQLHKESNTALLAACIVLKWRQQEQAVRTSRQPTVAQAMAVLKKYPDLREAVKQGTRMRHRFKLSSAVAGVCWMDFTAIDPDLAEHMWDKLLTGTGLAAGDPILTLRQWLLRQQVIQGSSKSSSVMTYALFIKTWNLLRQGRQASTISWRPHVEALPVAV